ncbi:MAG: methyl-accepting chemotaxis protein [Longimicrobiales bacterium]
MLSNLKTGTRLFVLLILLVSMTIAVGLVGAFDVRSRNKAIESVYVNELKPIEQMKTVSDAYRVDIVDTGHKLNIGLIGWDAALARVDSAEREIARTWAEFKTTQMSDSERVLVAQAEPAMQRATPVIANLRTIIGARDKTRLNEWITRDVYEAVDPVTETVDRIAGEQALHAETALAEAEKAYRSTILVITLLTLAAALIAIGFGYYIIRDIERALAEAITSAERIAAGDLATPLVVSTRADEIGSLHRAMHRMVQNLASLIGDVQRSGIQLNTSSTEISATSRQQQTTATEVASTTLEVGATARQISATSKELVRTMNDITESADAMATLAGSGQQGLSRMESSMVQITEATAAINTRFAVLNDRAANINTVVTTIAKVADRTNLLSLNAAIEAEKAGEYGRGFAVVATEIRRLADQTADATTDIEQMVREIQSAISAGVMGTDKFSEEVRRAVEAVGEVGGQLTDIIHQVQAVTPRFDAVVDGMQSQSEGAQQISEALAQLGEASQQTVESLVQSTEALEQLNEAARGLQAGVSRFKLAN